MIAWFRNRRRRKLIAEAFPTWWEPILRRNVGHDALLPPELRTRLRAILRVLVAEKRWEGARGFTITEEVKVTIAAQAAIPLLGLDDHDYLDRVPTIIVYPSPFRIPNPDDDYEEDDIGEEGIAGQAVYRGPVILAWDEVIPEGREPALGFNVVIHEFAHQLDFMDREVDGTPPLKSRAQATEWQRVMSVAFANHTRMLKANEPTFYTEHAADNETEFFADATEAYFCNPHNLKAHDPDVFRVLMGYFVVDPCAWFPVPLE